MKPYDYAVVFLTADFISATLFAILAGNFAAIFILMTLILVWSVYEETRKGMNNGNN